MSVDSVAGNPITGNAITGSAITGSAVNASSGGVTYASLLQSFGMTLSWSLDDATISPAGTYTDRFSSATLVRNGGTDASETGIDGEAITGATGKSHTHSLALGSTNTDFTSVLWLKRTGNMTNNRPIICAWNGATAFIMLNDGSVGSSATTFFTQMHDDAGSKSAGFTLDLDVWHMLCVRQDQSAKTAYYDFYKVGSGKVFDVTATYTATEVNANELVLGYYFNSANGSAGRAYDELAFGNVLLTDGELDQLADFYGAL